MKLWQYSELKAKLQNDLDLQDEVFITPTELLGYFNEGIKVAESQVHDLYEDWYLTPGNIALVLGTDKYSYPSDIYGAKIRNIYYNNGTDKYEIKRWRMPLGNLAFVDDADFYRWLPINSTSGGYQLQLIPKARETSATNVVIWYIRTAKVMVNDTDVCDLPELAINFVLQFVKVRCYEKEGHPNLQVAKMDLEKLEAQMKGDLANMVDDEDDTIRFDMSFYRDFDNDGFSW